MRLTLSPAPQAGLGGGELVPVAEAKAALSAFALGCKETIFRAAGKQVCVCVCVCVCG